MHSRGTVYFQRREAEPGHELIRTAGAESLACPAGHVFTGVTPGIPDGIISDGKGNVWSSSKEGVQVFSEQEV